MFSTYLRVIINAFTLYFPSSAPSKFEEAVGQQAAVGLMSFHSPTTWSEQQSIRVLNKPTWDDAHQLESPTHTQLHIWNIPQVGGKTGVGCSKHLGQGQLGWVRVTGRECRAQSPGAWVNGCSVSPLQSLYLLLQHVKLWFNVSSCQNCGLSKYLRLSSGISQILHWSQNKLVVWQKTHLRRVR